MGRVDIYTTKRETAQEGLVAALHILQQLGEIILGFSVLSAADVVCRALQDRQEEEPAIIKCIHAEIIRMYGKSNVEKQLLLLRVRQ